MYISIKLLNHKNVTQVSVVSCKLAADSSLSESQYYHNIYILMSVSNTNRQIIQYTQRL